MRQRAIVVFSLTVAALLVVTPRGAWARQGTAPADGGPADSVPADSLAAGADGGALTPAPERSGLPVILTFGVGYGQRRDPCSNCASPDNTASFTGHLSLGKPLGHGLGVGVRASVWRRSHPGPLGAADSTGTPTPTKLMNSLGNASVVFSWQLWHLWVEGGGGFAWSGEDLVDDTDTLVHASGLGIGYSVGAGLALPLAGPVSLAFFGNYNAGQYDLSSPTAVLDRGASHQYVEFGVGLTLR